MNCVQVWISLKFLFDNHLCTIYIYLYFLSVFNKNEHAHKIFYQFFSAVQNRFTYMAVCFDVPLVFHHSRLLRPGEAYCLSSRATRLSFLCISLWCHCLILPGGFHFRMVVCLAYMPVSHVVYKLERQRLMWCWCSICLGIRRNPKGNNLFIIYGLRRSITTSFLLPDWVQKGQNIMFYSR